MPVTKIISGGQTGADRGGLEAGVLLWLETGGHVPKGCRIDGGYDLGLLTFGCVETDSPLYPPRTAMNVRNSDGTVIFGNANSPGTKLTISLCDKYGKTYRLNPTIAGFQAWIAANDIGVLNVAGNREKSNPGIRERTIAFLMEALTCST